MREKNFFKSQVRKKSLRKKILKNIRISKINLSSYKKFGKSYFDDLKIGIGYGKYIYDGRFYKSVKKMISYFDLNKGDKILEVGCAKGFVLVEFLKQGLKVIGLDKSKYAKNNSHKLVKKYIKNYDIEKKLKFKDRSFDLVICKEVFPHISKSKINSLIREIDRVVKNKTNIYIEIQTFKRKRDLKLFKKWDPTHKVFFQKNQWKEILKKNKFQGYIGFKYLF